MATVRETLEDVARQRGGRLHVVHPDGYPWIARIEWVLGQSIHAAEARGESEGAVLAVLHERLRAAGLLPSPPPRQRGSLLPWHYRAWRWMLGG